MLHSIYSLSVIEVGRYEEGGYSTIKEKDGHEGDFKGEKQRTRARERETERLTGIVCISSQER